MEGSIRTGDRIGFVRLIRTAGVGGATFCKLLAKFGAPEKAIDFLERERNMKIFPPHDAERELEAAERIGARALFSFEEDYPYLLKQIPDRPPMLYVLGNASALSNRPLAIVGSRNASLNGRNFTAAVARAVAEAGHAVVSGMAVGIDTQAHAGALQSSAKGAVKTVAVLAGGVDVVYPPSNKNLYAEIIKEGAVVSEMPPGAEPMAALFPRRNRIISGLALGTLVVEAGRKSGSLITARYAAAQGREVFAVPNFPTDPRAGGTNDLIKNGAALVESAADVLEALSGLKHDYAGGALPLLSVREEDYFFEEDAADLRERILSLLSSRATPVDGLVRSLPGYARSGVMAALLDLELDGEIAYEGAGRIVKV
ncbi:MAG: DNA-processing protein DprA [Rickettsiales bacterium]|jgi:DNA processing protein|nr:DNA-processing protein DprA [Rickettsiales bacterium]